MGFYGRYFLASATLPSMGAALPMAISPGVPPLPLGQASPFLRIQQA